ncbi:hypothetical protein B0T21DRAFT_435603, partial [Apiosordaria backusii]
QVVASWIIGHGSVLADGCPVVDPSTIVDDPSAEGCLSSFPGWLACCCPLAGVFGSACSGWNGTAWAAASSAQWAMPSMTSSIASLAGRNPMRSMSSIGRVLRTEEGLRARACGKAAPAEEAAAEECSSGCSGSEPMCHEGRGWHWKKVYCVISPVPLSRFLRPEFFPVKKWGDGGKGRVTQHRDANVPQVQMAVYSFLGIKPNGNSVPGPSLPPDGDIYVEFNDDSTVLSSERNYKQVRWKSLTVTHGKNDRQTQAHQGEWRKGDYVQTHCLWPAHLYMVG